MSDLEQIGGLERLADLIKTFVYCERDDFIIGFLFEGRDLEAIIRHETAFAARHLGGDTPYEGRPLKSAHQPLKINSGHFRRRLAILKVVLEQADVPHEVIARWVAHDKKLESIITDGSDCLPE